MRSTVTADDDTQVMAGQAESTMSDGYLRILREWREMVRPERSELPTFSRPAEAVQRIDRDTLGLPVKLYPCTRPAEACNPASDPKIVVMNPRGSFVRRRGNLNHLEPVLCRRFAVLSRIGLRLSPEQIEGANPAKPPEVVFFVDWSLSKIDAPNALRADGYACKLHDDHFSQTTEDAAWLQAVARRG